MGKPRFAREGTIWVCAACGKTHKDRYGNEGDGDRGWDESCMLHAVLCVEGSVPWMEAAFEPATPKPEDQSHG